MHFFKNCGVSNRVDDPDVPARNQQIVHKILAKWALRPPTNRPIVPLGNLMPHLLPHLGIAPTAGRC
jgi:hypothetical protein